MASVLWKLTGGRPMRLDPGSHFTDVVSGKPVYRATDKLGRRWLTESPWALFRVPANA